MSSMNNIKVKIWYKDCSRQISWFICAPNKKKTHEEITLMMLIDCACDSAQSVVLISFLLRVGRGEKKGYYTF